MNDRKAIYESLRLKMEDAGFEYERDQRPHRQNRKESELVFIHPGLIHKFETDGYKVNAHKFYIKPLTDITDSEIGLVTGVSSPLYKLTEFINPNSIDANRATPAWVNEEDNPAIDELLDQIKLYLKSSPPTENTNLNTFLFAWNPQKWNWTTLEENIDHLNKVGYVIRRWSCGNSKNIKEGDRVFIVRLGEEPRGIMGSGYAKSPHFVAPHWDGTEGKTANYIDIEFDILINPSKGSIMDINILDTIDPNKSQSWFPQQSGISIKPKILGLLESYWFDFIRRNKYIGNGFISNGVVAHEPEFFMEGKSKEIVQTRYERNPQARKTCLKHYGYSCQICDFNFEKTFGEIGRDFIHVHHINAIAEIGKEYKIDPKNDLIPVCPNCHAMIHSRRPAFTIDEIKSIRRKSVN